MKIDPETEISKIIDVNQKITENILIFVAYFKSIMYTVNIEKGVCFRTALRGSLCGSLLCYIIK